MAQILSSATILSCSSTNGIPRWVACLAHSFHNCTNAFLQNNQRDMLYAYFHSVIKILKDSEHWIKYVITDASGTVFSECTAMNTVTAQTTALTCAEAPAGSPLFRYQQCTQQHSDGIIKQMLWTSSSPYPKTPFYLLIIRWEQWTPRSVSSCH